MYRMESKLGSHLKIVLVLPLYFSDRIYHKNVKEVQVQFQNENPAWIPYDTLISMMSCKIPSDYTDWKDL